MHKSLKIGLVCYPTFGGSGIVATELGKALAEKGHEIHFITYSKPVRMEWFTKNMYYHEVSVSDYPLFEYAPYELLLSSKLVDVAINQKLDILHVHYAIPHASAAFSAQQILKTRNIDLPFITTLHGTDITLLGKDKSFQPVIEFAINQSDSVTAVSESLKEDTYQFFDIKKDIEVIPNFIDPSLYHFAEDIELRAQFAEKDEVIITHISNFRKVKRVDDVIRIFEGVQQQLSAKLLMVGDGPELHQVKNLARELGISDKVFFLGKSKRIEQITSISDVFLLPSETESFGLVALEAMASGVAVVSSNVGGLPEVNKDGVTGFLNEVGDIEGMIASVLTILKDKDTLARFKTNALEHSQKFELNKIVPEYENLYLSLVKN
ncbi:MAG TPA: N-acetyl-alpha-D-glucosaminyl L-malate synthase BshA [Flavobacteriales bacterium]|nr:N-acetyl-alpha-D-glucosaminyl L-malate synthase BshA [Flavobacteriales bacterium]|tara:strand:- start:705 stop:1841 length:1137 start_codon:yes stop_codon:yes gene_type:complete